MSLQFIYGASGTGKSSYVQQYVLNKHEGNADINSFMIVPDQYTMQVQKHMVNASPRGGIMNIDIVSFSRLAYRIFEEVGGDNLQVLDDTGKNLIIRRIAADKMNELKTLGSNIKKTGFIHEVKSVISEFMQYGISPKDVENMIENSADRPFLQDKLADINVLYNGFLEYIRTRFITTEEKMDKLAEAIYKSELVRGSIVVLDGFTGFTPVQNKVIEALLNCADQVLVTVTIAEGDTSGENDLFALSRKTVASLKKLAERTKTAVLPEIVLKGAGRLSSNSELLHLEKNLFRYPYGVYKGEVSGINVYACNNPKEELRNACIIIKHMIATKKWAYRDIAVVTGNLSMYEPYAHELFARFDIPGFVDSTRHLEMNPFTEYIRSALGIVASGYHYEDVMHFMRCGIIDCSVDEIDRFDNYIRALGIGGASKYNNKFVRYPEYMKKYENGARTITTESLHELEAIDHTREMLHELLSPIDGLGSGSCDAGNISLKIYEFIENSNLYDKTMAYCHIFEEKGDYAKAAEYRQIYPEIIKLLERIQSLLGGEELTLSEYIKIFEAGLSEIKVGVLPAGVDQLILGDIERTRLDEVKMLILLGVNDGVIPASGDSGGIISDFDREYLVEKDIELAPTPRQKIYIQRLYLYMVMTKPTDRLVLSYSKMGADGKSMKPSYMIAQLGKMFGGLKAISVNMDVPSREGISRNVVNIKDAKSVLAAMLNAYEAGQMSEEDIGILGSLYMAVKEKDSAGYERLKDAALYRQKESILSSSIVNAVYGAVMENSVSKLEQYSRCAYAHFLRYGLTLKEQEEFSFGNMDMGNLYHNCLEAYGRILGERGLKWHEIGSIEAKALIDDIVTKESAVYGENVLNKDARTEYTIRRLKRILLRTVNTIAYQTKVSALAPTKYEVSFRREKDINNVRVGLSDKEKMIIRGIIDRVDTYEEDDCVYVKIVDYKSSNRKINLVQLYHGVQLQLAVYMKQIVDETARHTDKKVRPAGMFYYHVADPYIEGGYTDEAEINRRIAADLKQQGLMPADERIIELNDSEFEKESDVINLKSGRGAFTAGSAAITEEDFDTVLEFADKKIGDIGSQMRLGDITPRPYDAAACECCAFKGACGFDIRLAGCEYKQVEDISEQDALERMKGELHG